MSANPRLAFIRAFVSDLNGWGFFLCTYKDVRQGRTGETFIALTLQDKTAQVRGRILNEAQRLSDAFEVAEFVKAKGHTDLFNGRMQLVIDSSRRVNLDQGLASGSR